MNSSLVKFKHPDAEYFVDTPSWFFDDEFKNNGVHEFGFPLWYLQIKLFENSTKIVVRDGLLCDTIHHKLTTKEGFIKYLNEVDNYCRNHESFKSITAVSLGFNFECERFKTDKYNYVCLKDIFGKRIIIINGRVISEIGEGAYRNDVLNLEKLRVVNAKHVDFF